MLLSSNPMEQNHMDPMVQQQQMGLINDHQNNLIDPMISEEGAFNDYPMNDPMDPMLDHPMGSGLGPEQDRQDYYDSEYGSSTQRSPLHPPHSTRSSVPPHSKATAAVANSEPTGLAENENSMMAMAAFQQHQDNIEPHYSNPSKISRHDSALSRKDSASSLLPSSGLVSVKVIEDKEDEYGKMKMALLSEINDTSFNGSSTPLAAITSPSMVSPLTSPKKNNSVRSNKPTQLGPRTRSKDNLESIFGGVSGVVNEPNPHMTTNNSGVPKLLLDDRHASSTCTRNVEAISGKDTDFAHMSVNSLHYPNSSVEVSTTAFLSSSKPNTCNNNHNNNHGNRAANQDHNHTKNTSQNKNNNKYHMDHVKYPITSTSQHNKPGQFERHNHHSGKQLQPQTGAPQQRKHHHNYRPSGFIKEEPYPADISPDSNIIPPEFRRSKSTTAKYDSEGKVGDGDKMDRTASAAVSSSTTGDVYTIPELPEEEEDYSPLGADGVSKMRKTGRFYPLHYMN